MFLGVAEEDLDEAEGEVDSGEEDSVEVGVAQSEEGVDGHLGEEVDGPSEEE